MRLRLILRELLKKFDQNFGLFGAAKVQNCEYFVRAGKIIITNNESEGN